MSCGRTGKKSFDESDKTPTSTPLQDEFQERLPQESHTWESKKSSRISASKNQQINSEHSEKKGEIGHFWDRRRKANVKVDPKIEDFFEPKSRMGNSTTTSPRAQSARLIEGLGLEKAATATGMSSERRAALQDHPTLDSLAPIWQDNSISLPSSSSPKAGTGKDPNPHLRGELASSLLEGSSTTQTTSSSQAQFYTVKPLPIQLGLERITTLLDKLGNPQDNLKVIHVAGTNGKGSTCAYLTSSLVFADKKVGQFTSPHLIDRWDGITINNQPIPEPLFLKLESEIKSVNEKYNIQASTFEVLTACAFSYFSQEKVDIAVIEAGMGGKLDATNVFKEQNVLVNIITPISLDHVQYLGDTVEEIAKHKAGIMKRHVPVVVAPHPLHIQKTLEETAHEKTAEFVVGLGYWKDNLNTWYIVENVRFGMRDPKAVPLLAVVPGIAGTEQGENVACAVKALSLLEKRGITGISEVAVQKGIAAASVPGRMEWVRFETEHGQLPMLLDGAHNPASCRAIGEHVNTLRKGRPVVWIVGFSEGRDIRSCLSKFVQEGDYVAAVEFGPVDGMPWVRPVDSREVAREVRLWSQNPLGVIDFGRDLVGAIRWGVQETKTKGGMLAATGSLYLVGGIHRLRRLSPESDSDSE